MTVYTAPADSARVLDVVRSSFADCSASAALDISVGTMDVGARETGKAAYERQWFLTECRAAHEEGAALMLLRTSAFYGDGSLGNLARYCEKTGIATFGPHLDVPGGAFLAQLEGYRARHGSRPISNARLVDVALSLQKLVGNADDVDRDRNASYRSGTAYRAVSTSEHVMIQHNPALLMFWPTASDLDFERAYAGVSVGRLWPEKMLAEGRLRLMGSSDVCFFVNARSEDYAYPLEDGRRFNEQYAFGLPSGHFFENTLVHLRTEPFLA